MFNVRQGLNAILKEGSQHFSYRDETLRQTIVSCNELSELLQTCYGPNSSQKLIVNHVGKTSVSSDSREILSELEVQHPSVKLIVTAALTQADEWGDMGNYVILFACELLKQAEMLISEGVCQADVIDGYELALEKAREILAKQISYTCDNILDAGSVKKVVKSSMRTKPGVYSESLLDLVTDAITNVAKTSINEKGDVKLDVEKIRVAKITGSSLGNSELVNGIVVARDTNGSVKSKTNPVVAFFNCGLEMTGTECKSTVLIKNADELLQFSKGEEQLMEQYIVSIKKAKVDCIIVHGGNISDLAQHYCEKYEILTLKIQSKFEAKRIAELLNCSPLMKLGEPFPEELGRANKIYTLEMSSRIITIIETKNTSYSTIILKGGTNSILDEASRAVDAGANCAKACTLDSRFIPGAGACEIEAAIGLQKLISESYSGLEQHSLRAYANALEMIPLILASNAGAVNPVHVMSMLSAAHFSGITTAGVNIKNIDDCTIDTSTEEIYDHYKTKINALELATNAAITILKVDNIIMAKPAGGPDPSKAPKPEL